jgi:hypothetical protein
MSSIFDTLYNQPPRQSMFAGANEAIAAIPQGRAPAAKKPGLLDYIWGVAAGYNPNDVGRMYEQREQASQAAQAQRMQQASIAAGITDPTERALFQTAPQEWAKNVGQQYAPQVIGAGAAQAVAGRRTVEQPSFTESGDTILRRTSEGIAPVFTRTTPSIAEQVQQGRLAADVNQFDRRLGLDERKLATDTGLAQAELGIKQADLGIRQSEAQRAEEQRRTAAAGKATAQTQTADSMEQALTRGREFIDAAGVWTNLLPWQRQKRANLEGQIDTLKGNLTFDKLMDMKNSSPTGASGLGALSDSEARMLAATVASLSADMSPPELERSFAVVDGLVKKLRETTPTTGGGASARPIAVNPRTGARVQWNGSQWVPL